MKTLTATEVARRFSHVLDELEHGGEEIVVVRNNQPVARLIAGTPRMGALEALGDLFRTLDDADGQDWLTDMHSMDRPPAGEIRDPWE